MFIYTQLCFNISNYLILHTGKSDIYLLLVKGMRSIPRKKCENQEIDLYKSYHQIIKYFCT